MKKYIYETKNELDSFLLRDNEAKKQLERFSIALNEEGKFVDATNLSRGNELTGAGINYISTITDYFCTHHKESVRKVTEYRRSLPEIKWEAAIEIATAGIPGQKKRAECAIHHLHSIQRPVRIIDSNGTLYSMIPFIMDMKLTTGENVTPQRAAKIARLNKKPKKGLVLPIETITIVPAYPLIEDFWRQEAGTYSFPTGMYAKFFHESNELKKSIAHIDPTSGERLKDFDSETHVFAFVNFARYIMRHHNLTGNQIKDKTFSTVIEKDPIKIAEAVYPSAIKQNGHGTKLINRQKFLTFISEAVGLFLRIDDFLIYPVHEPFLTKEGKIGIRLFTSKKNAMDYHYENCKKYVKL